MNIKALKDSEIMLLHKDDLQKLYRKRSILAGIRKKNDRSNLSKCPEKNRRAFLYYVPERRYYNLLSENPQVFQLIPLKHITKLFRDKTTISEQNQNRTVKH